MLRGNWSIIFAVVGCLALAIPSLAYQDNYASRDRGGTRQTASVGKEAPTQITASRSRDQLSEPQKQQQQSPNEQERDVRDLAAQERMAFWAEWMFWAVIFQTVLAAGALVALILDLRQNRISGQIQMRAYFSVESVGYHGVMNDGHAPSYSFHSVNRGQTPAYSYIGHSECYVAPLDHVVDFGSIDRSKYQPDYVGPGSAVGVFNKVFKISPEQRAGFLNETHAVFIVQLTDFSDAFGRRYRLELAYRSHGPKYPTVMKPLHIREIMLTKHA